MNNYVTRIILGPVFACRTTDRSHVEFYMTEASTHTKIALLAYTWRNSQQLFVCVYVSAKKTALLAYKYVIQNIVE